VKTSTFRTSDGSTIPFIHNDMKKSSFSILFIHGLGDSSLAWKPFVQDPRFSDYNLIAPDLVGYGNSEPGEKCDFGYVTHSRHLFELIEHLDIKDIVIVGHSMGGVIASFMVSCYVKIKSNNFLEQKDDFNFENYTGIKPIDIVSEKMIYDLNISRLINVEGNLTSADAFISARAVKAYEKGSYDRWFKTFKKVTETSWINENPKSAHYAKSLNKCNPQAFLQGSKDLNFWKKDFEKTDIAAVGILYKSIQTPKIYLYGSKSVSTESINFINEHSIESKGFEGAGHWVMNDSEKQFTHFLEKTLMSWT
jgi:alpha/beta hydrolase fold